MHFGRSTGVVGTGALGGPRPGHGYTWCALALGALLSSGVSAAQPSAPDAETVAMPKHVYVAPCLRDTIAMMLQHSPTFREQVATLARTTRLGMAIKLEASTKSQLAEATIRRFHSGLLLAVISIHSIVDKEELIAHEIEHVREQIEGLDLARLARTGKGVTWTGTTYETERAINVGHRVGSEIRAREASTP